MMLIIKHLTKPMLNEFPPPGLYLSARDLPKGAYLAQCLQLPAKSGAFGLFRMEQISELGFCDAPCDITEERLSV